ncbi:MAG: PEGA domain-containing protein [Myxococcota bacterium]|jgi:hypothetical protein|nr:PEGA domain-containing protein [Myxococcota bacterium]
MAERSKRRRAELDATVALRPGLLEETSVGAHSVAATPARSPSPRLDETVSLDFDDIAGHRPSQGPGRRRSIDLARPTDEAPSRSPGRRGEPRPAPAAVWNQATTFLVLPDARRADPPVEEPTRPPAPPLGVRIVKVGKAAAVDAVPRPPIPAREPAATPAPVAAAAPVARPRREAPARKGTELDGLAYGVWIAGQGRSGRRGSRPRRSPRWILLLLLLLAVPAVGLLVHQLRGAVSAAGVGQIEVISTPPGASIVLDGQPTGRVTPATLVDVDASTAHELSLELPSYRTAQLPDVFVSPDEVETLEVRLQPLPGTLEIVSEPAGADVLIAGRYRGKSPIVLKDLDRSRPIPITLQLDRHEDYDQVWTWRDKRRHEKLQVSLDEERRTRKRR